MQHAKAPGSVLFEPEEIERINRAQIALLVHKFQSEVDAQPYRDMMDLLHINNANDQIQADRAKKRRGKGK